MPVFTTPYAKIAYELLQLAIDMGNREVVDELDAVVMRYENEGLIIYAE